MNYFRLTLLCLVSMLLLVTAAKAQNFTVTPVDSVSQKAYTGTYTFGSGSPIQTFTVTLDKGELYGEADSFGKNKLIKQAKADTYQSTSSYGSIITFVRDAATKAVISLTLAAQGTELLAKKNTP